MRLTILLVLAMASCPALAAAPDDLTAANAEIIARNYPASSIRRGEEGPVDFRIALDREGKIESCAITKSSGYSSLDERTCDMMVEKARFVAIRNSAGWRTNSVHEGRIVWRIPDDKRRDTAAVKPRTVKISAEDTIVCRRQLKQGSLYVVEKLCFSKADWRRQREYSQTTLHNMQSPGGGPII